jgi:hypothetical protein
VSAVGSRDETVGFDIDRLLDFEPATGRCIKCLALLPGVKDVERTYRCPICGLTAIRSGGITGFTGSNASNAFTFPIQSSIDPINLYGYGLYSPSASTGLSSGSFLLPVNFNKDAMDHAKELAGFARLLRSVGDQPPLRVLVGCLLHARAFVHFTTWGISQAMLGVLAAVSEFVPVAGIASAVDRNTQTEIEKLRNDFPRLDIRAVRRQDGDSDLIHVKLIVIDGLLALSGSPNLTTEAWRKTAVNKERLDIVTDVQKVIDDNNRYFASHWAELQADFDASSLSLLGWNVYQPSDAGPGDGSEEPQP